MAILLREELRTNQFNWFRILCGVSIVFLYWSICNVSTNINETYQRKFDTMEEEYRRQVSELGKSHQRRIDELEHKYKQDYQSANKSITRLVNMTKLQGMLLGMEREHYKRNINDNTIDSEKLKFDFDNYLLIHTVRKEKLYVKEFVQIQTNYTIINITLSNDNAALFIQYGDEIQAITNMGMSTQYSLRLGFHFLGSYWV